METAGAKKRRHREQDILRDLQQFTTVHTSERHEAVAGGRRKSTENEVQSPTVLISRAEVL